MFLTKLVKAIMGTFGLLAPMIVILAIKGRMGEYHTAGMGADYPAFIIGLSIDSIIIFVMAIGATAAAPVQANNQPPQVPVVSKAKIVFLCISLICLLLSVIGLVFEYQTTANIYKPEDLPIAALWTFGLLLTAYVSNVGARF